MSLEITLLGMKLRNPLLLASGILGSDSSLLRRIYESGIGGVVTKSFTREPREGYKTPIIIGLNCGFVNAVGLANPGINAIHDIVRNVRSSGAPVIVSIAGSDVEEFVDIAKEAKKAGANAIELNFSCPHAEKRGLELSDDPELIEEIIRNTKRVGLPVISKFGVKDNLRELLMVAQDSGSDVVTLINTIKAMKIDVWTMRPVLSNKFGGLSGKAIHPIAVRVVYEAYELIKIPIIGVGGIDDWESAVEMMLAGARAVQIGSAIIYKGLNVIREILDGLKSYLTEKGFRSIDEIVGLAHKW